MSPTAERVKRCKLCLQFKTLQDSHLMPAAIYKKTRGSGRKGSQHPYTLTDGGRVVQNSRQISDYVLCRECEHRLNANGEDYVMRLVTLPHMGDFPLLKTLRISKPTYHSVPRDLDLYSEADSKIIDRAKIAYFAASVFWRAAVHTWRDQNGETLTIRLGTEYEEEFRQFLLGNAEFPTNSALVVFACKDRLSQDAFFMPTSKRIRGFWVHGFLARGILFALMLGKTVRSEDRSLAMVGSREQWILVADGIKTQLWWLGTEVTGTR